MLYTAPTVCAALGAKATDALRMLVLVLVLVLVLLRLPLVLFQVIRALEGVRDVLLRQAAFFVQDGTQRK